MQAIWWAWSMMIAIFAVFVTYKFSKFTKQQNDIALEEFRPIILPVKDEWSLMLKNEWINDAIELEYYISTNTGNLNITKIKKIENIIIPPNWMKKINLWNIWWYHSIIFVYKNPITLRSYLSWFNYFSWNNFLAIWENEGTCISPLDRTKFQNLYKNVSIKNQIINNIDFTEEFDQYLISH